MPRLTTIHTMMQGCFAYMPVQIHQVYVCACLYIIFVGVLECGSKNCEREF